MKKRKLTKDEIDKIIFYIFENNNKDKSIKFILYEYLPFIQKPDIIPSNNSEDKISNYHSFMEILHKITGKNIEILENMKKENFIDSLKN
jgi:hypothetical protein